MTGFDWRRTRWNIRRDGPAAMALLEEMANGQRSSTERRSYERFLAGHLHKEEMLEWVSTDGVTVLWAVTPHRYAVASVGASV